MAFYKLRSEYLEYLVHASLLRSHWSMEKDRNVAAKLREHLTIGPFLTDLSITQDELGTHYNILLEVNTEREEGFSKEEIASLVWGIFQILAVSTQLAILNDEGDLEPRNKLWKPALEQFKSQGDFWSDEFNDPRPFGGNLVELESFRKLEYWHDWASVTMRLSYSGTFDASFGTYSEEHLRVIEFFEDHVRVDPGKFTPEKYLQRLEGNFEASR